MTTDPNVEQPFRLDLDYYEGRTDGIATVNGVTVAEARRELAARHGFADWAELRRHVEAMARGEVPPTPFVLAYQALEANDRERLVELLDRFPDLVAARGTNGNDLLGMAGDLGITCCCSSGARIPTAVTTTAGRSFTRPATATTVISRE